MKIFLAAATLAVGILGLLVTIRKSASMKVLPGIAFIILGICGLLTTIVKISADAFGFGAGFYTVIALTALMLILALIWVSNEIRGQREAKFRESLRAANGGQMPDEITPTVESDPELAEISEPFVEVTATAASLVSDVVGIVVNACQ